MKKKTTIRDLAEKAGVSRSAAWAALNPNKNIRVSDETREKVLKIASELNFRPNMIAKGLVCKKSFLLGLVFNRQASLYAMSIIDSVHKECARQNYSLIVYPVSSLEEERHSLQLAVDRQVDGILAYPFLGQDDSNNKESYDNISNSGIPLVQLIFPLSPNQPCFGHDFYYSGETATNYLLQRGHKKIVFVTNDNYQDKIGGMMCYGHHQGYKEAMQNVGLHSHVVTYKAEAGDFAGDITYQIAEDIINSSERPTAVVCSSNYAALGLIKRWQELEIKIPDDISIFGCTNNLGLPQIMMPRLTSFESCYDKIGSLAVDCCLNLPGAETAQQIKLNISEGNTVQKI
jgi:DNA-binding LacI/PurR family transcriptional regulator